jgi:thiamine phosphate synthase YjbQ (UPF0047 family)
MAEKKVTFWVKEKDEGNLLQNGKLQLGTWQQIILIDFDNRARRRELVVQVLGT